jgi:hypothetical protein
MSTWGEIGQDAPAGSGWRFTGLAVSVDQSIVGGAGDGVGVVAGGSPDAATPVNVPGTHSPAGPNETLL